MGVEILTPDGKKTTGNLVHARVNIIPIPGQFEVSGFLIDLTTGEEPDVVVHMTLRGDNLAIIDHALGQFRQSYRAAVKALVTEMRAQGIPTGNIETPSAEDIQIVKETKGS